MTSIIISDELYKNVAQTAKQNNVSLHRFVEQALRWAVRKVKENKETKYDLKSVEELPEEIRNIIGIAKGADIPEEDLDGRSARMEYLKEKYGA